MEKKDRKPKLNEIIEGEYNLIDWKCKTDFPTLTTDFNPIHTDIDYISKKIHNQPIAHGQIGVSLICALLGNTYKGIMLKNQMLNFSKPVLINTNVKPEIRCISIKNVNTIYNNLEITFIVKLMDVKDNVFISGKMLMFMWGDKK